MKNQLLLIVTLFTFFSIFDSDAQDMYPGFVVTTKNDTIKGNVVEGQWMRSPRKITMQTSGQKQEVYEVDGLKSFSANNITFEAYRVDIPINSNAKFGGDTEVQRARVFLEILARGKNLSLFRYYDGRKTGFYVQSKKDSVPVYLVYSRTEVNGYIRPNEKYKNQLTTLAIENGTTENSLLERIKSVNYHAKDLIKVVNLMNGEVETSQTVKEPNGYRAYAGLGIMMPSMSYDVTNPVSNYLAYNQSTTFSPNLYVSVGGDYKFGRAFVRMEFSYSHIGFTYTSNDGHSQSFSQTVKQNTLGITARINYNLVSKDNLKFYVGAGMKANIASYPENSSTSNFTPEMRTFYINLPLSAGLVINNNTDIAFTLSPSHLVTPVYGNFSGSMSYFQLGINYFFIRGR
jgi:hypothetical protein